MVEGFLFLILSGITFFSLYLVFGRKIDSPAESKEISIQGTIHNLSEARVLWVIDGDTIVVKIMGQEIKIRLDSIDCPEDGQYWGDKALYGLISMIGGKTVYLQQHGLDHYGRTLATIFVWNHTKNEYQNVNERMVMLGHAWVMRKFYGHLPKNRQDKLNQLERWAKSKKIGLWHQDNPIPPWNWRKV